MLPKYRVTEANLDYKLKNKKGMLTTDEYICNLKRHGITTTIPDESYKGANTSIYHFCKVHNYRFKAQPSNIMNGYPCPLCNKEKNRIINETNYKQKLLNKNISVSLDDKYISHSEKVYHICLCCNNRWKTSPAYVLKNKYPCPKCANEETAKTRTKTQEKFENKVREILGDSISIIGNYMGAKNIIDVHCNVCNHDWTPLAESLLVGHSCPRCRDIKNGNRSRKTIDQYKEEVKSLRKDTVVISDEYINAYTPLLHQCVFCEYTYYETPSNILSGNGKCPLCNKCYEISENEFVELLRRNGKQIKLLSSYKSKKDNIECQCLICNYTWTSIAYSLLTTMFNCPNCAINERKKPIIDNDKFVERVHQKFPNIELLHEYQGSKNSMDCRCNICNHNWTVKHSNKLYYNGCPHCASSKLEMLTENHLKNHNIAFTQCMKFDDLLGIGNGKLSYDFYLPTYNLFIECQGEQHERPVEYFGGIKKFVIQKIHDTRKRKYANDHNIKLLEIWYYENNKINKILEQTLNNLKSESLTTAG